MQKKSSLRPPPKEEPPVFETPVVEEAPPPKPEPEPEAPPAKTLDDRLADYVRHRLQQHLPTAIEFYVQELKDVIAGKKA